MPDAVLSGLTAIMRDVFADEDIMVDYRSTAEDIDGWDSLSHARLIMQVERHFHIKLAPAEYMDLDTVGDLADLVSRKLAAP